ncbi:MAG: hypothetical protein ACXAC7_22270, partial [Candidatus Hodarchaeales archaeon]
MSSTLSNMLGLTSSLKHNLLLSFMLIIFVINAVPVRNCSIPPPSEPYLVIVKKTEDQSKYITELVIPESNYDNKITGLVLDLKSGFVSKNNLNLSSRKFVSI